ncbi:hypothetical protein [Thermus thermophilus]|nr:hypothetical protein [Thermus thermophilus]BDG25308.1 hypothetical protein TthSNM33_25020 [Thermus thermophilus]
MKAKEVVQRLRADGVARVEGVVEPEWGHEAVARENNFSPDLEEEEG